MPYLILVTDHAYHAYLTIVLMSASSSAVKLASFFFIHDHDRVFRYGNRVLLHHHYPKNLIYTINYSMPINTLHTFLTSDYVILIESNPNPRNVLRVSQEYTYSTIHRTIHHH